MRSARYYTVVFARHDGYFERGLPRRPITVNVDIKMVQLTLRPEIETKVREQLSAGLDANDLMEAGLEAMSERDAVRDAIDEGWHQAEAGDFVESSPESIIRRADQSN